MQHMETLERNMFKLDATTQSKNKLDDQMVFLLIPLQTHTLTHTHVRDTYATGDSLTVALVAVAISVHTPTSCCHKDDD